MSIKHKDIEIPAEKPFANCKLGREKYAKILTNIATTYSDGFVLAINNEWGAGKTTFIKMWQQHLNNGEFKTLYFNAWENDYDSNPLAALMSELKTLSPKSKTKTFDALLRKGALFTKSITPNLIKAFASKYITVEALTETIKNSTETAMDILKDEIDIHTKKKEGLVEFRKNLENFINEIRNDKPVIFLIDELDRCRPNYAVEVLETIKHFFNVPGIVFVISIDKQQLCSAIKGYYGSENFNSTEYLRRFFDLEYSITSPNEGDFCRYLYEYFKFDEYFLSPERIRVPELQQDKDKFIRFSEFIFKNKEINLRLQEKIYSHAKIVTGVLKKENYFFPSLSLLLIYFKILKPDLYKEISDFKYTPQQIIDQLSDFLPSIPNEYDNNQIGYIEALLVYLYYNNYKSRKSKAIDILTYVNSINDYQTNLKSGLTFIDSNNTLLTFLKNFNRSYFSNLKLDYLLNFINLTENIS